VPEYRRADNDYNPCQRLATTPPVYRDTGLLVRADDVIQ